MAWSRLQSASSTVASGNGTVTFSTANLSSGSKIICAISVSTATGGAGNNDMTSVKLNDTAATALTSLVAYYNTADQSWLYLYAVDTPSDAVGTKPTVTATWNTSAAANFGLTMLVQEVSGLLAGNTSAMLDGTPGTNGGTSTGPATTGSYSSTAANEYLIAVYGDPGDGITVSNATGSATYTADANNVNANNDATLFFDYGNSTHAAESASFTLSGSATAWNTILVAFQLAAAPSGGPAFYPAVQALRARILPGLRLAGVYMGVAPGDTSYGTGQVQWNAGGPVRNPPAPLKPGPLPNFPAIIAINSGWRNAGHSR